MKALWMPPLAVLVLSRSSPAPTAAIAQATVIAIDPLGTFDAQSDAATLTGTYDCGNADPGGLAAQELRPARPAASRCRSQAVAAQNGAHRGSRHPYAQLAALADNTHVPPTRVLSS